MPKMSWERPIEEVILDFTRHMARCMEQRARHGLETGWFKNNRLQEDAQKMATAYRTVEKHIKREVELRNKIKKNV